MPQRSSKPAGQSTGTHALINTPDQWAKLWSAIGAGDAPEIDLTKDAVLSLRVPKGKAAPAPWAYSANGLMPFVLQEGYAARTTSTRARAPAISSSISLCTSGGGTWRWLGGTGS